MSRVWLDDERPAPEGWLHVKTAPQCIEYLTHLSVYEISLDHDLGTEETGYDVLLWIEQKAYNDPSYTPPRIYVHTANPAGRTRMIQAVESIARAVSARDKAL